MHPSNMDAEGMNKLSVARTVAFTLAFVRGVPCVWRSFSQPMKTWLHNADNDSPRFNLRRLTPLGFQHKPGVSAQTSERCRSVTRQGQLEIKMENGALVVMRTKTSTCTNTSSRATISASCSDSTKSLKVSADEKPQERREPGGHSRTTSVVADT